MMDQRKYPLNPGPISEIEKANRRSLLRSVALRACDEQNQIPHTSRRRKFLGVFAGNKTELQVLPKKVTQPCPTRFHGENASEVSYGVFYQNHYQPYVNSFCEVEHPGKAQATEDDEDQQPNCTDAPGEKDHEKKLHFQVKPALNIVRRHEVFENDD